jgi:cell division septation protein DedD
MAEKRGGGGFFWGVVGFLVGVAMTLAVLAFMSRETNGDIDQRTAADEAAESAQDALPEAPALPAPTPKAEAKAPVPRGPEPGLDPASDDQIADDAASSGMTSRAPPPEE